MDWTGYEALRSYVSERREEFELIPGKRKQELEALRGEIRSGLSGGGTVRIIFICTHNSRRSHMSQLWAQLAACSYGLDKVHFFSGGTEATTFHPNAVKAMKDAGFPILNNFPGANPLYKVTLPGNCGQQKLFSKKYTDPPNPPRDFMAVMTCSDAEEACPVVIGASSRHSIQYEDPKVFDGTPGQKEGYAERCRQIAREMIYLFSGITSP